MKAKRKLNPGQPGTKKWLEKYGDDLVCVRYRYDAESKQRATTIELIVEQKKWEMKAAQIPYNKIVFVKTNYEETYLRKVVKSAGGRWNRQKKLWELPYGEVKQLGFTERIVLD